MSAKPSQRPRLCKVCIEEGITSKRPAPHPGPRCMTHHRAVRTARRQSAHGKYVQATYGISEAQYWALYEYQGGRCYICQRATGRVKKLCVDHDHSCCNGPTSCGRCVRGLLCGTDNKWLGHIRDNPEAAMRAAAYLTNPPARRVLGEPQGGSRESAASQWAEASEEEAA